MGISFCFETGRRMVERKRIMIFLKRKMLLMTLLLCGQIHSMFAQITQDEFAVTNQLIVQLHAGNNLPERFSSNGFIVKSCLSKRMNIFLIEKNAAITESDIAELAHINSIQRMQYNHRVTSRSFIPNDPYFSFQWNLLNDGSAGGVEGADIQATEAWPLLPNRITTASGDTIVLAIVEVSFDLNHEDINYFINHNEVDSNGIDDDGNGYIDDYSGWNAFDNNGFVSGGDNHSMHVSGIAAAKGNNGLGISGVAPGFKVLPVCGSSELESEVVRAYDYVVNMRSLYDATNGAKGAFIVATNASFGVGNFGANPANYPIWCAMYDSLGKYGILTAASGPNSSVDVDAVGDVPTSCPSNYLISLTNTTRIDAKNGSAAYGKNTIDLGAPGTAVYGTFTGNQYGTLSGTSMASPHVTGAIGAMYALACPKLIDDYFTKPDSVSLQFRKYLLEGVTRTRGMNNKALSNGRLNLYRTFLNELSFNCDSCSFSVTTQKSDIACADSPTGAVSISSSLLNLNFQWSNGDTTATINNLTEGIYTVTISDNTHCQIQKSFFFDYPQPIQFSAITTIPIASGNAGNFIVSAAAGNDSLYFSLDNATPQISGNFSTLIPGLHTLSVINQYGCRIDTIVNMSVDNSIEDVSEQLFFETFPNPAKAKLNIVSSVYPSTLELFDIQARLISSQIITGKIASIDLSQLSEGVYLLQLSNGNKRSSFRKVSVVK